MSKRKYPTILILLITITLFLWSWFAVPDPLISSPYSTIIESAEGELLGARIADDGQWRFPEPDSIPTKFKTCLLTFEDRYFYTHPGINPVSLGKAFIRNIKAGKIVSGGSTITMQLSRIARKNRSRTYVNKLVEIIWALNIELRYSKNNILKKYASNAPFGGNVVGLEAASWRYYKRKPSQLSWSEAATLAVLPNAPSLIYPGKNDPQLILKRNWLLKSLFKSEKIDSLTYELSLLEALPDKVYGLPVSSYHLLERAVTANKGDKIRTTINVDYQAKTNEIVSAHVQQLKANHVYNMAAIIADVHTGNVLAYAGNVTDLMDKEHGYHVDIIQAPRSTGSILKPFLYAEMIDKGVLAPTTLIPDIPGSYGGFSPVNFDKEHDGAVQAQEALARSLNVPAVGMLKDFGIDPFYDFLKKAGMTTLNQPAGHYGLSLILGGSEVKMWDLAGMYTSFAKILRQYEENDGYYDENPFRELAWRAEETKYSPSEAQQPIIRAAAIYETFKALLEVKRPEEEAGWESFASSRKIAWKTGTSFGFRDAWAVGVTKDYVVGVWAGNADGEGRSGLTGASAAAPAMFEIFEMLPPSQWFQFPIDEMEKVTICHESGFLPSMYCPHLDTVFLPKGLKIKNCAWHHLVHLDKSEKFRVSADCANPSEMIHKAWFVLPPVMANYYKQKHPFYKDLPAYKTGCLPQNQVMELIYPREMNRIFVPIQLDGTLGEVLFEIAHQQKESIVYWYVDDTYIGETVGIHQKGLSPTPGRHSLYLIDEQGNQMTKGFIVGGD